MQIDWLTVIAQIVNFAILILLLKHFLYARIINAMDQREKGIADRLIQADQQIALTQQERESFEGKTSALQQQTSAILSDAKAQAEVERQQTVENLREEVAETSKQWKLEVEREKQTFLRSVSKELTQQVVGITRRALNDLADVELEQFVVRQFIKRLGEVDPASFNAMRDTCKRTGQSLVIETAFTPDDNLRTEIRSSLDHHFGEPIDVVFRNSTEIVCGISLIAPARRITWSIDAYLDDVETDLASLIKTTEASSRGH